MHSAVQLPYSHLPLRLPCEGCLHDAGFQSGMIGADRCALLEALERGALPEEWSLGCDGSWRCSQSLDCGEPWEF